MRIIYRLLILFGIIGGLAVGGLSSFYIMGFLNYAVIEESYSFYYKPAIRAEPEKIRIITDGRTLNILHNTSSVPYCMKADVNLKAEGIYMRNSDYDYFFIEWLNFSSEPFTELLALSAGKTLGGFYHPTWTAKYDININVTLRTDISYDLHLHVWEPYTEIFISENLSINELIID